MTEIDLADGLRAWAQGRREFEAAVELLIAHRTWLIRATSPPTEAGIGPYPGARLVYWLINEPNVAAIDWSEARYLARSTEGTSQDRQMLSIAVSMAEQVDISHSAVAGLDEANLNIVNQARHHLGS
jgi:hypothetical protein